MDSGSVAPVVGTLAAGAALVYVLNNRKGSSAPEQFSYKLEGSQKGIYGAIHRHPAIGSGPLLDEFEGDSTLYQTFQRGVREHPQNKCMGTRPISADGKAGPFQWITYAEANLRAIAFGDGLMHLNLIPTVNGDPPAGQMRLLALLMKNRAEWAIAEQGLFRHGGTTVPLYDTLGPDTIEMVVDETELTTIVLSVDCIKKMPEVAKQCKSLKNIIVVGGAPDADIAAAKAAGLKVYSFEEVEKAGKDNPSQPNPPTKDQIATFCYTSGTTGKSKGALLSHRALVADLGACHLSGISLLSTDFHLSYLPLAHAFERMVQAMCYRCGAAVGFYQGDTLKLMEDLKELRPTIFPSVPRLLNKLHDKITGGAKSAGSASAFLFGQAYSTKLAGLKNGWLTHKFWDGLVFKKVQKKIGLDRCRFMITGSAPIASHVLDFLRVAFCCPVIEGYGQTEAAAGTNVTHPNDFICGHVGGPVRCCEIRLVSVPEMDYLVEDKDHNGIPCTGRGEIWFRGPSMFSGYYKMADQTRDTLDPEGWVHSGDIGMWTTRGTLKIIDRKKNIFKLAQGEYIAPEKIEQIYQRSEYVAQSFVYGDSYQSVLVAIIVPDPDGVLPWAKAQGKSSDMKELIKDADLKALIMKDLDTVGRAAKLTGFERVKEITLHHTAWTPDDLLTPTFKLKRNEAKKEYQTNIDGMYESVGDVAGKQVKQGHH